LTASSPNRKMVLAKSRLRRGFSLSPKEHF
jgi:hypothetical protein